MNGHAHGKVILLGEHAVVYGHPALAGAINLGIAAEVTRANRDRVRVDGWGLDAEEGPVVEAVRSVYRSLGFAPGWLVVAGGRLPPRAGLGSSAALLVATARALLASRGREAEADAGASSAAANEGERVFHGNPSGVDVALASRGGFGLFRRGVGIEPVDAPPFRLAIGLSGEPRDTRARVADVARRRELDRDGTERALTALGLLATRGAELITRGPLDDLGELFTEAQEHLAGLGLSSPKIDELVVLASSAGASGAKLTGAGGGGAVIAVGPIDDIVAAWRGAGFEAFAVEVGTQ